MTACIEGCTVRGQHVTDCEDRDTCRGCLPRRASNGLLCWPCHRRFELMLTDAPTVWRWLTGNMAAGSGAARPKQDYERKGGDGSPAPIKADVLDLRDLLADRLACWVDDFAEDVDLTKPERKPGVSTVEADAAFLLRWINSLELCDWIGDWWEELAETMSDAHALAPWRPEMKRVRGVPCPECEETNLAIFGGESDVTCLSCRALIPEAWFGLWEQILEGESETIGA